MGGQHLRLSRHMYHFLSVRLKYTRTARTRQVEGGVGASLRDRCSISAALRPSPDGSRPCRSRSAWRIGALAPMAKSADGDLRRSDEHPSKLQSLMRIPSADLSFKNTHS